MKEQETFQMTYSAAQQDEVQAIRKKYLPKEETKLEQLRALDARAGKTATTRAITAGVVGALVLGIGMSLVMSDFGLLLGALALPVGIVTGLLGLALVILACPLYQRTLQKERRKIAPEILRLSEELMR